MDERVIAVLREVGEPYGADVTDACLAAARGEPLGDDLHDYGVRVGAAVSRVLTAFLEARIDEAQRRTRGARHEASMAMLIGKAMSMPVNGWH